MRRSLTMPARTRSMFSSGSITVDIAARTSFSETLMARHITPALNHFISGILKTVILEASCALLLVGGVIGPFGRWAARERWNRQRLIAWFVIAGLAVFSWCNYGS